MIAAASPPPGAIELKVVGKSGQISLGKRYAGKALRVEHRPDGTILLTAVAMIPESQLWTLSEPHRSRIERGLAWTAEHPARETDLATLEQAVAHGKGRGKRSGRTR